MCGNALASSPAAEPEYVVEKVPAAAQLATAEAPPRSTMPERVVSTIPVSLKPLEPPRAPEPEVAPEPPPRSDKWWVDEGETTVGGPSFLGISSADSGGGSGGYSYLFQEEEERSHKAAWVLLLVLLVLGGVVYAKWQPIRDYVLTTAITHSRPQPPPAPAQAPANDNSQPASAAPGGTTLASSDAPSQPTITTDPKPNSASAQKEGLPQGDGQPKDSAAPGKPAASASAPPADAPSQPSPEKPSSAAANNPGTSSHAKNEPPAPRDAEEASNDEDKPSPAMKARTPQPTAGAELVTNGEKYLYGRGVARSCSQAVSYFNAAAAQQNPQALSHLGALYATGECVPMDRATAYAYFRRAYVKEPSNHYFEQNLTMLWREMTPDERQRATGNRTASF